MHPANTYTSARRRLDQPASVRRSAHTRADPQTTQREYYLPIQHVDRYDIYESDPTVVRVTHSQRFQRIE